MVEVVTETPKADDVFDLPNLQTIIQPLTASETIIPATAVTQAEVDQVREQVHTTLAEAQKRSEASGKPLLIMVGESHSSSDSALMESIIYQQARAALGVKDMALEMPSDPAYSSMLTHIDLDRGMMGAALMYRQANYFGATTHMVDDGAVSVMEKLEKKDFAALINKDDPMYVHERNAIIATNLAAIAHPTMMITGLLHLHELTELTRAKDSHEIVSFDVANGKIKPEMLGEQFSLPPDTQVLHYEGDAGLLTANELITYGLGSEAPAFIGGMEAMDVKISTADLIDMQAKVHKDLQTKPDYLPALAARSFVLYELGEDEAAGKAQAEYKNACRKTEKEACVGKLHLMNPSDVFERSYENAMEPAPMRIFAQDVPIGVPDPTVVPVFAAHAPVRIEPNVRLEMPHRMSEQPMPVQPEQPETGGSLNKLLFSKCSADAMKIDPSLVTKCAYITPLPVTEVDHPHEFKALPKVPMPAPAPVVGPDK